MPWMPKEPPATAEMISGFTPSEKKTRPRKRFQIVKKNGFKVSTLTERYGKVTFGLFFKGNEGAQHDQKVEAQESLSCTEVAEQAEIVGFRGREKTKGTI